MAGHAIVPLSAPRNSRRRIFITQTRKRMVAAQAGRWEGVGRSTSAISVETAMSAMRSAVRNRRHR
jgi:hypothetical protein